MPDQPDPKQLLAKIREKKRRLDQQVREATRLSGDKYADHAAEMARRNREESKVGRDIGPIPAVADPKRRAKGEASLDFFLRTYFAPTFYLPWSDDHLTVIHKTERAVKEGGLFAMAMPRGNGKTSIAECACLWAIVTGARQFVCLIGSSEAHAMDMLESLKMELSGNEMLLADFPETCYPIHCLEGIANRCRGQLHNGNRTHIGWTATEVIMPTIPDSKAAGSVIKVAGLTGRIRGMKHKLADGRTIRPSLVVLDDPQTDESARSMAQSATRESILAGAVLGLAGPGKKIAGIMPCTVIYPGDMADAILDRDKHPEWQGERTKMVYSFPSDEKLWDEYAKIRGEGLLAGTGLTNATAYYRKHRKAMDAGSAVAWAERYNYDELSAIQHAMGLRLQDERAFWAEYQNEPMLEKHGDEEETTADQIASRLNGYKRGEFPSSVDWLTAFVDVHDKLLYWMVVGWSADFSGWVLDYGSYPDQKLAYYTLANSRVTMAHKLPGAGREAAILAGLDALFGQLLLRDWIRDDGAAMRINLCLVDAGYLPNVVHGAIRQSDHAAVLMPSIGIGVKASNKPFREYKKHRGDRAGDHWRIPSVRGTRELRTVQVDTNYWKSFGRSRLVVPMGDDSRGCVSLWGKRPATHQLLSHHLMAEYRVKTEGRGRVVDDWNERPDHPDNHLLDDYVGNCVAASILGVTLAEDRQTERIQRGFRRRRGGVSYMT